MSEQSPRVPDAIEPVVGWRYWRLDEGEQRLTSLGDVGYHWVPGTRFEAACTSGQRDPYDFRFRFVSGLLTDPHTAPEERCRCGIYAARTLEDLRAQMLIGLGIQVVGEVHLWGKVVPGTLGYRAQYAYPRRLYVLRRTVDGDRSDVAQRLEEYGVPIDVIPFREAAFQPVCGVRGIVRRAGVAARDLWRGRP